jgi:membrane-associated protein
MVGMSRSVFMFFNITGSAIWVSSMILIGYFLDSWVTRRFDFSLQDHIEVIAIGIVLVTTLPVLYKLFFSRKDDKQ